MDRFVVRKRGLESEPLIASTAARQAPASETSHPDRIVPADAKHLEKNSCESNARVSRDEPAEKKISDERIQGLFF